MCNCNWSTCFHLFLKKRYYTSITSKYISKPYNYIFCSGILTKCLHDHLTHTLRSSHDVCWIYRLIRRNEDKFLYSILIRCSCSLISSEYIIFNRLIRTIFHKRYMFMCCRMKYNIWAIIFHYTFNSACISNGPNQYFQFQIWIFSYQFLLNIICIILIDIKYDQKFRIMGCNLTAKLTTYRSATTGDQYSFIAYILSDTFHINIDGISSKQILNRHFS